MDPESLRGVVRRGSSFQRIAGWLKAPEFSTRLETRRARILNRLIRLVVILGVAWMAVSLATSSVPGVFYGLVIGLITTLIVAQHLLQRGELFISALLVVSPFIGFSCFLMWSQGLQDTRLGFIAVLVAGLLVGRRGAFVTGAMLSGFALLIAMTVGLAGTQQSAFTQQAAAIGLFFELAAVTFLVGWAANLIDEALGVATSRESERVVAERARIFSEAKLDTVLSKSPIGIGMYEVDHGIVLWNSALEGICGWTAAEVQGRKVSDLGIFEGWTQGSIRRLMQRIDGGGGIAEIESQFSHKSGAVGTVVVTLLKYPSAEGKELLIALVRDVSEQRKSEQNEEVLQEKLHRAQRLESIGRLTGGLAHDFNNLLTVIQNQVGLLELRQGSSPHLSSIEQATDKAAQLVMQLLAYGRRQVSNPVVFDLNHWLAQERPIIDATLGADVNLSVDPCSGTAVVCLDPTQMTQVVMNLCVNAKEAFAGTIGDLEIATRLVPTSGGLVVSLVVADNGPGIPEAELPNIFEPFYSTKARGSGLGLASVYGLVRQNEGTLTVESAPGQGTRFEMRFPVTGDTVRLRRSPELSSTAADDKLDPRVELDSGSNVVAPPDPLVLESNRVDLPLSEEENTQA